MIIAIIVTRKTGTSIVTVPDRVPSCALQINIRSLLKVVPVEVAKTAAVGIIGVGGMRIIVDKIRQRLQIGGGTDKPGVVLRAAATAQKFIGGG